ncbi:hypothetical protein Acr_07g0011960 [Actinidia rufa]|uniref:Uncharacterized protein n=1 Tax=Actinidia rufa TaxID=165716 RepID=A0A7J0EX80_9ERIC|nr:hypothetical protein Acr_07g0011960 [Actinidia rufa]
MPPRQARDRVRLLIGARVARGARGNRDEGMIIITKMVFGGMEFMQWVFTAIEQVVRNMVQTKQVPIRATNSKATTAMKAFLQLRPLVFKAEPDLLVTEDWLQQVTRALDMILVMGEELRVFICVVLIARGHTSMVEDRRGERSEEYEAKFTNLLRFVKAFVSMEEEKSKQFMRGLRPSIRNKIAENLIKVYSTMISQGSSGCHQPGHRVVDHPLKANFTTPSQPCHSTPLYPSKRSPEYCANTLSISLSAHFAGVDAASAKAGFNFLGCVLKLDWRLSDESPSEDCGEVERDAVYRESVTCKVCLAFTSNIISSGGRDTVFVGSPDLLRRS